MTTWRTWVEYVGEGRMTSSPGSMRAMMAEDNPSMAPTVTSISEGLASIALSCASFWQILSLSRGSPAFPEYPPHRPSLIASMAPALMCSGVPEVGLAHERKATSSTSADSLVISWIADFPMPETLLDTTGRLFIAFSLFGGRWDW